MVSFQAALQVCSCLCKIPVFRLGEEEAQAKEIVTVVEDWLAGYLLQSSNYEQFLRPIGQLEGKWDKLYKDMINICQQTSYPFPPDKAP